MVRNQDWPLTDAVRSREMNFAMESIRQCANNECAWNYLSAFCGDGSGKVGAVPSQAVCGLSAGALELSPGGRGIVPRGH